MHLCVYVNKSNREGREGLISEECHLDY